MRKGFLIYVFFFISVVANPLNHKYEKNTAEKQFQILNEERVRGGGYGLSNPCFM
jgi:hypothetical protein